MTDPVIVYLPSSGVWRVGRAPDPFAWSRPEPVDTRDSRSGNRFDSFHGDYGLCYFGTTAEACFAETLARFRPSATVSELVSDEWAANGWMQPGNVPADWRDSRILVRAVVPDVLPFVDVASAESLEAFRTTDRIAQWLNSFGLADVDLATLVGSDRRVTRLISQWVFEESDDDGYLYGGIRYLSRLGA